MADFAAGSGRRYRNSAVCPVPRTRRYSGLFVSASGHHRKPRCTDAVYTDKHAVFQPRRNPSDLPQVPRNGSSTHGSSTQWGRALGELGITQILAHSPEAKGRVERANGTFQDRLVAELRLAGACTLAEANQVLTEFCPGSTIASGCLRLSRNQPTGKWTQSWTQSWTWVVCCAVAPSGQRQHGAIPRTGITALSQYRAAQLCRSSGGGARTSGWSSTDTA